MSGSEIKRHGSANRFLGWDIAGDGNVIYNLSHLFMRDVQVAVLVYSIDSKKSFDNLDEWLEILNETNEREDYSTFLIGNKSDLYDNRAVPERFGENKSSEISQCVMFKETSTYNDVRSVENLFKEIGAAIIKKKHATKSRRNSIKLTH